MTVTLQKTVEQVSTLSAKEREELGRFPAESMARKQERAVDPAQLLASIRRRRSFALPTMIYPIRSWCFGRTAGAEFISAAVRG